MSESILREKAKDFAKNIVFITKEIKSSNKESVLTNQLLRSGTSIMQISTKHTMHKERLILFQNLK